MQTIFASTANQTATEAPRFNTESLAPNNTENGNTNRTLVDALVNSKIYKEYERAFSDLTGLPIALQPVETWQLPHHNKRYGNPFCALMSQKSR